MDWKSAQALANELVAPWQEGDGPGGGILLFDRDSVKVQAFGGLADIESRRPFTSQSVVRLASLTKHVVSSLVLDCADDGLLRLSDRLADHLPTLKGLQRDVTIRAALDMTGGLPDMIDSSWMLGVPRTALLDRDRVFAFLATIEHLNFVPGEEFSYSNAGYRLIEAILEARGVALASGLAERFFGPLGMNAVFPRDQTEVVDSLAPGYWFSSNGWRHGVSGMPYCGADGLAASAGQFAIWLRALLSGKGPARGLLERLAPSTILHNGRDTGVGLGIARSELGGRTLYGFMGGLPGYRSVFQLAPDMNLGVLAVANREDADVASQALAVMSAALGIKFAEPQRDGKTLANGLYVGPDGPDWLEINDGYATSLGTQCALHPVGDGQFDSRAFYLPMTLRQDGVGIAGDVGHRFKRFEPIAANVMANSGWAGEWAMPAQNARFRIDVDGQEGKITLGSGPILDHLQLIALDARRALFERSEGPRRQRVCLWFSADFNSVLLSTQRSRVLRFHRA